MIDLHFSSPAVSWTPWRLDTPCVAQVDIQYRSMQNTCDEGFRAHHGRNLANARTNLRKTGNFEAWA